MAKSFFTEQQKKTIQQAIAEAERDTSGEIRVHIDDFCEGDPFEQALVWFERLGMHETKLRNGVLFYLAVKDRKLAILGDQGINDVVDEHFWDAIRDEMVAEFKVNRFSEGLISGIVRAGKQLKTTFPYQADDVNELSDDISFQEDAE